MNNDLTAFEKIPVKIFSTSDKASQFVATQIATLIRTKEKDKKPCVLGLATGSTPTRVYAELVRMHREEGLSILLIWTNTIQSSQMRSKVMCDSCRSICSII
jgi:glucosamine-6-phosphate deaminase